MSAIRKSTKPQQPRNSLSFFLDTPQNGKMTGTIGGQASFSTPTITKTNKTLSPEAELKKRVLSRALEFSKQIHYEDDLPNFCPLDKSSLWNIYFLIVNAKTEKNTAYRWCTGSEELFKATLAPFVSFSSPCDLQSEALNGQAFKKTMLVNLWLAFQTWCHTGHKILKDRMKRRILQFSECKNVCETEKVNLIQISTYDVLDLTEKFAKALRQVIETQQHNGFVESVLYAYYISSSCSVESISQLPCFSALESIDLEIFKTEILSKRREKGERGKYEIIHISA